MALISERTIAALNDLSISDVATRLGFDVSRTSSGAKATCIDSSSHKNGVDKIKSLSFKESDGHNFCNCFSCGFTASGPIDLYGKYNNIQQFPEKVRGLAELYGMTVEYENDKGNKQPNYVKKNDLREVLKITQEYYTENYQKSVLAQKYTESRGFTQEDVKKLGYGFNSGDGGVGLIKALEDKSSDPTNVIENAIKAGVLKRDQVTEKIKPTIFGNRLTIPITNGSNQLIGFGARDIVADPNRKTAKYINSPESEMFHKGKELYNLYDARRAATKSNQVLVVEGYLDVDSLKTKGIGAVAAMGVAISSDQIEVLQQSVKNIVFCFDGDFAGHVAAFNSLKNSLPVLDGTSKLGFLFLPDGEDPDSLVNKIGPDKFLEHVDSKKTLTNFFVESVAKGDLSEPEDRVLAIHSACDLLKDMKNELYQRELVRSLSMKIGVPMEELQGYLRESIESHAAKQNSLVERKFANAIDKPVDIPAPVAGEEGRRAMKSAPRATPLSTAIAETGVAGPEAVARAHVRPKSMKVRNSTPEARFKETHRYALAQLLEKPKIGVDDFRRFLGRVAADDVRIYQGNLNAENFKTRVSSLADRYIKPDMLKKGQTNDDYAALIARLDAPQFSASIKRLNIDYRAEIIKHDPSCDDATYAKPGGKKSFNLPQLEESNQKVVQGSSPGR